MEKPKNHGAAWTSEQDAWLWKAVQKKGIDYCAEKMERTKGGIRSRLKLIISKMFASNQITLEEASLHTGIDVASLREYITRNTNTSTENAGASWSEEQDKWLWKTVGTKGIPYCIERLKRTRGSISCRLKHIVYKMYSNHEITLEDASKHSTIELSVLKKFIENRSKTCTTYYAVREGRVPGIYDTWTECKEHISGFKGAVFKKFTTRKEADDFMEGRVASKEVPIAKNHITSDIHELHEDQQKALDAVRNGESILLTGPAGTGKTTTIKAIRKWAVEKQKHLGVSAMTGTAGFVLGGRTLHSFLGIGLGNGDAQYLVNRLKGRNPQKIHMIRALQMLVIDEVSMLDVSLFDKISEFLSIIRNNPEPFGGIQMILTGDFCQLPPVEGNYCFLGKEWQRLAPQVILLTKIFRQDGDTVFQELLMRLRWGNCNADDLETLKTCLHRPFGNDVRPTRLYALNRDVDRINTEEYTKLIADDAQEMSYKTQYCGDLKAWVKSCMIPEDVTLCVGAQVVITWNVNQAEGLSNGTRGVVTAVHSSAVEIRLVDGKIVSIPYYNVCPEDTDIRHTYVRFMPLKLAFALSIHKSQGMTLDAVEIDLGNTVFTYGQAYTALSRAKSLASVSLTAVSRNAFFTHPEVKKFYGQK